MAMNHETLGNAIAMRPKILHISSHGFFDNKTNQFFLAIEQGNGVEDRFGQDRLKVFFNPLNGIQNNIKLVFVSAC